MNLRFDDLPDADEKRLRARLQAKPTRRGLLKAAALGGVGVAFGSLALLNRGVGRAEAAYFLDYTDTATGPCGPGNYASGHTEAGIQCGPSAMCLDHSCCWKYRDGAGNQLGWHKEAPGIGGKYYLHRPDACWAGIYDSWRWKFSDGKTYRCSDGWTCANGSCVRTICPWAV